MHYQAYAFLPRGEAVFSPPGLAMSPQALLKPLPFGLQLKALSIIITFHRENSSLVSVFYLLLILS
jgi:hypothetical protein